MVLLTVAYLIDDFVTEIAGGKIIHNKCQVIHIVCHFAAFFDTIGILIKTPCHHSGGIGHGKIELNMVTRIVPAPCYKVGYS